MSLRAAERRLHDAVRLFAQRWAGARDVWRDEAAARFEREHVDPVAPAAERAAEAIRELDEQLSSIRASCE